ncbi:MAG: TIGR02281 family clan AA aspartic protease [Pseudorhodobacter sp.]
MDGDITARLLYLGILIAAVGGYLLVEFRGRIGQATRQAAAWALIILGLMAGYGLWSDMRTTVMPRQSVLEDGAITIPRAADGHYYLELTVSGTPINFLVDTGATNIVLSQRDAERVGIDPRDLVYLGSAQTANGVVRTARVTLNDVELGPLRDSRVTAYVNDGEMDESLLGMDYLGRFRVEIDRDRMILTR